MHERHIEKGEVLGRQFLVITDRNGLLRQNQRDGVIGEAAGVGAAMVSFAYTWVRFDYGALEPGLLVVMFALRCTSGALLGGVLGYTITNALFKTGVLSGLKIDHDRRAAA